MPQEGEHPPWPRVKPWPRAGCGRLRRFGGDRRDQQHAIGKRITVEAPVARASTVQPVGTSAATAGGTVTGSTALAHHAPTAPRAAVATVAPVAHVAMASGSSCFCTENKSTPWWHWRSRRDTRYAATAALASRNHRQKAIVQLLRPAAPPTSRPCFYSRLVSVGLVGTRAPHTARPGRMIAGTSEWRHKGSSSKYGFSQGSTGPSNGGGSPSDTDSSMSP